MKIDQDTKDFLIEQVVRLREFFGYGKVLEQEEYKIENLLREYTQLSELEDYYSPTE